MPINEISKAHFDSLVETSTPLGHNSAEERAWFATGSEGVIGTVINDAGRTTKTWVYAVFVRQKDGRFEWVDGGVRHSKEHAIAQLKDAMERREASG
ncbi:MAG: hypothetical protein HY000_21600 [Planctomycetes bacterium]|nr:hypothetical protein [Planctomycetota bacterium]